MKVLADAKKNLIYFVVPWTIVNPLISNCYYEANKCPQSKTLILKKRIFMAHEGALNTRQWAFYGLIEGF